MNFESMKNINQRDLLKTLKVKRFINSQVIYQILKYLVVGLLAAGVDVTSLFLLTELFDIWYVFSAGLSYLLGLSIVFILNKYFTFQKYFFTARQLKKYLLLSATNYILVMILIYFFTESLDISYLIAKMIIILLQVMWNFPLYKFWVFKY